MNAYLFSDAYIFSDDKKPQGIARAKTQPAWWEWSKEGEMPFLERNRPDGGSRALGARGAKPPASSYAPVAQNLGKNEL